MILMKSYFFFLENNCFYCQRKFITTSIVRWSLFCDMIGALTSLICGKFVFSIYLSAIASFTALFACYKNNDIPHLFTCIL